MNSKSSDDVQTYASTAVSISSEESAVNAVIENNTKIKQSVSSANKVQSKRETSVTKDKNSFITNGYWYLFDDENTICYVFSFKDNGNVDLAIFNEANINGEDPQYFEGYSTYNINSNDLKVKIPASFDKTEQKFLKIENEKLYFGNVKLEKYKNLKMDYAIEHFI